MARHPGICSECGRTYDRDERVEPWKGSWAHAACVVPDGR